MKYGLIGEKLSHSYSKIIHELIGGYTYDIYPVAKDSFNEFMKKKDFYGINVTIPYKQAVMPFLNKIDEKAKKIGAVNTITNDNGYLTGYNTDFDGFLYTIKKYNIEVAGKKALVLGNGGASKAVIAVLNFLNAEYVKIVYYKENPGTITPEQAIRDYNGAEIIINTTPVGMYPNEDNSPLDLKYFKNCEAVLDLIYNPLKTKIIKQAESLGMKTASGLDMLSAQAVYASEYFQKKKLCTSDKNYIRMIDGITSEIALMLSKK